MNVLVGCSSLARWGYRSKVLAIYMLRIGSIYAAHWIYISNVLGIYVQ